MTARTDLSGEDTILERSGDRNIKLYGSWFCPYVQRVWIALEEKGIDYQYIEINPYEAPSDGDEEDDGKYTKKALSLSRKRELYPDFVEASPRGLVPAMRNDSDVLSDSTVILEYIDEAFTCQGESLFPSTSPSSRAKARFWSIFINEKIIPHYYKMLMQPSTDDRETAKLNLLGGLIELAGVMSAEGPFFFGETFGIVDIMLAPWWLRILSVSKFYRNFEVPRGKSTSTPADPSVNVTPEDEAYSRLHQWYAAVRHRRSFVRTVMNEEELIRNYAGYADNSATSDAAGKFRSGV